MYKKKIIAYRTMLRNFSAQNIANQKLSMSINRHLNLLQNQYFYYHMMNVKKYEELKKKFDKKDYSDKIEQSNKMVIILVKSDKAQSVQEVIKNQLETANSNEEFFFIDAVPDRGRTKEEIHHKVIHYISLLDLLRNYDDWANLIIQLFQDVFPVVEIRIDNHIYGNSLVFEQITFSALYQELDYKFYDIFSKDVDWTKVSATIASLYDKGQHLQNNIFAESSLFIDLVNELKFSLKTILFESHQIMVLEKTVELKKKTDNLKETLRKLRIMEMNADSDKQLEELNDILNTGGHD